MGRKLDALLGRGFKTAKFKTLVNLAISRLAVLKNQRQVRSSQARSDVVQLLNLIHHDRALLRVELVIKEQNMLDAFVIIEGYCHLLIERVFLIANESKECPDELKEAISTLIFSASRCGEFPELQEIRNLLTSRYGREFASRSVELRNGCGVNPKIIQKFSTRQPSLEMRMKLLREIASENGITLKLQQEEEQSYENNGITPCKLDGANKHANEEVYDFTEAIESMNSGKKYRDVVSAAQAAFESAAYAAAAARAAVELSQEKSQYIDDPDDPSNPPPDKIHPSESSSSSDSEGDDEPAKNQRKNKQELVRSLSASSSDSFQGTCKEEKKMSPNQKPRDQSVYHASDDDNEIKSEEGKIPCQPSEERAVFDKSDDEAKTEKGTIFWSKHSQLDASGIKQSPLRSQDHLRKNLYTSKVVMGSENEDDNHPMPMAYPDKGRSFMESKQSLDSEEKLVSSAPQVNKGRKPISVRTRRS